INQTYHIKRRHISTNLAYSLCYAKHQKSILPRLVSTLGRSSPGPDQAPFAQALGVDTRSSSVDTRDPPRKPSGQFGIVCRH
ncbi:hypothetical protein Taro_025321, partial [Colocasia esculenta]|nr:hypothetical protein [Colocasia esculenta]